MLIPFIISGFILAVFTVIILKSNFFKLKNIPRWLIVSTFYAKLIGGILVWYLYTYYYTDRNTADIYKYFDDAQIIMDASADQKHLRWHLFSLSDESSSELKKVLKDTQHWDKSSTFFFNDNRSIIRINFIILFFSKGFFHLHTLIFCILSFMGGIALMRFFMILSKIPHLLLFLFIFFIPSTLLFTSGAIKESWLFFCLGYFLFFTVKAFVQKQYKYITGVVFFGLLLIHIKSYIAICLIPAILFLVLSNLNRARHLLVVSIVHLSLVFFLLYFQQEIIQSCIQKQNEFIQLAKDSNASSYFELMRFSTLKELIISIPSGIYNVWFRPFMHLTNNPLTIISALESLFLVLLIPFALIYFKRPKRKELILILFCFSYLLILSLVIGLNIPIMGAVIRYKVPMLAFYSVLILSFINFKRVPVWFNDSFTR